MSDEDPKRVIIMRGVPGSGKSTAAKWLASGGKEGEFWLEDCVTYFGFPIKYSGIDVEAKMEQQRIDMEAGRKKVWCNWKLIHEMTSRLEAVKLAAIHSTDQYFMVDGEYRFNQAKIGRNHSKNYKAFRDSVDAGIPLVIVDNTNTTRREWAKYENYAKAEGYWVSFHVMPHPTVAEAKERNTHGVPGDVIKKMIQRFE